ncbi:unnamed protein product [Brassica oleracea]|uniref:Reverse transcriptase zinc-binding domain-containing protein n=1 Tax=Brassica oleracea TaxID=3712 RepID=A0A3P6FTX4_BRAOL|nr:unnamed protein product [Brassica oleracea]
MANKILKAKDCVYSWIKMRVGNDSSCRFWWDNWSPFGKLLDFLNEGNKTRLGIPLASRLEDLCIDGAWSLPPARTENQWTQTVTDLQSLPAAGSYTQLVLLAWQSTMYYLWAERNNRLHNSSFRSGDSIFLQIDSSIRNRISSRRDQNPGNSSRMLQMLFSTDH